MLLVPPSLGKRAAEDALIRSTPARAAEAVIAEEVHPLGFKILSWRHPTGLAAAVFRCGDQLVRLSKPSTWSGKLFLRAPLLELHQGLLACWLVW